MIERRAVRFATMGFARKVRAHRFALVRLVRGPLAEVHPGLVAWFEATRAGEVQVGVLDATRANAAFWSESFRTSVGPLRIGASGPELGYYLFEYGLIVGFHTGLPRTTDAPRSVLEGEHAVRERLRAIEGVVLSERELHLTSQMIHTFDEVVRRRDGAGDGFSWTDTSPPPYERTRTPPPPPRGGGNAWRDRAPEPDPDDPYVVLGVPADATDEQIASAYKEAMRLNHPDKVAHLSPALQKFAEQQTLAIRAAWDRIRALRGGRSR